MKYWTTCLFIVTGLLVSHCPTPTTELNLDGGWSPWQVDPDVDCCIFGNFARYQRFCNNPSPEGDGKRCPTSNNTMADIEDSWRTCTCACWPPCDNVTSFCANDTGRPAYCQCKYGWAVDMDFDPNNVTTCSPPGSTTYAPGTTGAPATLDPDVKKKMNYTQWISVVVLLACLGAAFLLMICFFGFKPLRIIQINQELTLAATFVLIGYLIENTGDKSLCTAVAILVQYFYLCTLAFFCLEALYTYSLVTYVVPSRGFLHTLVNILLGYGVPLIPLAFSVGFLYDVYGTNGRHCWCDLGTKQTWAFLVPIVFGAFMCTVISEAQSQGKYEPLQHTDESEYRSAKISEHTVLINMLLSVAAYVTGLIAIDMQNTVAYIIFCTLTILLGVAMLLTHCAASPRLAAMCPSCTKSNHGKKVSPSTQHKPSKGFSG